MRNLSFCMHSGLLESLALDSSCTAPHRNLAALLRVAARAALCEREGSPAAAALAALPPMTSEASMRTLEPAVLLPSGVPCAGGPCTYTCLSPVCAARSPADAMLCAALTCSSNLVLTCTRPALCGRLAHTLSRITAPLPPMNQQHTLARALSRHTAPSVPTNAHPARWQPQP